MPSRRYLGRSVLQLVIALPRQVNARIHREGEFLEAGKRRLSGDTARQATSPEVKDLRSEAMTLKECVADLTIENRLLKKSMTGVGVYEE